MLQSGWLQAVETLAKHNGHSSYVLDTVPWQCMHIVVGTLVANFEVVSKHTSFMDLIEGRGAFVRDVWKRVMPKKPTSQDIV